MPSRIGVVLTLVLSLAVSACGIATSPPRGLADEIEEAADATAELAAYEFSWTADYELSEAETGRSELQVTGSGAVDATNGDVEASITYDDQLREAAQSLFPDADIEVIQAFTRVVGDEVYVRGFNVASVPGEVRPAYDTWYEISERRQDLGDPFVSSEVLPTDVLPVVVEPLVDAGELSVTVDRDFVLDLGTRFSRSLFDFDLRIGGGDFVLAVELDEGLVRSLTIEGDDPGSGVSRFTFAIQYLPVSSVTIDPPDQAVAFP